MDEPPDFDYIDDEDDFEELCREELMNLTDHDVPMDMEPSDDVEMHHPPSSSSSTSSTINPLAAQQPDLYTSPHKMYQSPEVFKQLNNEFSKGGKR